MSKELEINHKVPRIQSGYGDRVRLQKIDFHLIPVLVQEKTTKTKVKELVVI